MPDANTQYYSFGSHLPGSIAHTYRNRRHELYLEPGSILKHHQWKRCRCYAISYYNLYLAGNGNRYLHRYCLYNRERDTKPDCSGESFYRNFLPWWLISYDGIGRNLLFLEPACRA